MIKVEIAFSENVVETIQNSDEYKAMFAKIAEEHRAAILARTHDGDSVAALHYQYVTANERALRSLKPSWRFNRND